MRAVILTSFIVFLFASTNMAQVKFPVEFKVEKQAMSTPMSDFEDIVFLHSYYICPLNINFNGKELVIKYENGTTYTNKEVTLVDHEKEYDNNNLIMETYTYTDNSNSSDNIFFVVDYGVGYVQIILTAKNSNGESIGFTSYKQYIENNKIALH